MENLEINPDFKATKVVIGAEMAEITVFLCLQVEH